eukprot:2655128-Amphidinium_carterae.1
MECIRSFHKTIRDFNTIECSPHAFHGNMFSFNRSATTRVPTRQSLACATTTEASCSSQTRPALYSPWRASPRAMRLEA